MRIIYHISLLLSRFALYVCYFPLLLWLNVWLSSGYRVQVAPRWNSSSHFCYILFPRNGGSALFFKVRNPLSSFYNRISGRKQPTTKEQLASIMSLGAIALEIFPPITVVQGRIAMEYFPQAKTLDQMFPSAEERHFIAIEIARLLSLLHGQGFIHGDVKGKNILYFPKDRKVLFIDIDYLEKATTKTTSWEEKQEKMLYTALGFSTNEKEGS